MIQHACTAKKSAQMPAKLWLVSVIFILCVDFFLLQYFLLSQINVQKHKSFSRKV